MPVITIQFNFGAWDVTVRYKQKEYKYIRYDGSTIKELERIKDYKPFKVWQIIQKGW